ncbi:unnamed protein product [Brassica rapa subsp. trilocularis]
MWLSSSKELLARTHTQSSHASKAMHTLNTCNPLLFSLLIVFHFVLFFSIPLSISL